MSYYHPLLDQGIDPDDYDHGDYDDDPEFYLIDDGFYGECSGCGYEFGPGELDLPTPIFVVEESGKTPDTPDGPGEYWAVGYIDCPNCHAHLPYEVS